VIILETKVLKKIHRRFVKSFLDVLVLMELRNNVLSGYDFIGLIHNKFRMLFSSGTVYSLLYSMEREGLIKGEWNQKKRVYMLTEKGEETVKAILNANNEIESLLENLFSF